MQLQRRTASGFLCLSNLWTSHLLKGYERPPVCKVTKKSHHEFFTMVLKEQKKKVPIMSMTGIKLYECYKNTEQDVSLFFLFDLFACK